MWSRDIPHEIPRRRLRPSNGKLVPITRAYRYQSPSPSASAVVPARERRRHKAPSQSFPQGGLADEGGPDTPPPRWCAAGTGGVNDGAHRAASAGLGRPRARGPSGERRSTGERNSTASWRARRLFALTWLRGGALLSPQRATSISASWSWSDAGSHPILAGLRSRGKSWRGRYSGMNRKIKQYDECRPSEHRHSGIFRTHRRAVPDPRPSTRAASSGLRRSR
jgi:hypothetical protein